MTTLAQFKTMINAVGVEHNDADIELILGSNQTNADVVWVDSNSGKVLVADTNDHAAYVGA